MMKSCARIMRLPSDVNHVPMICFLPQSLQAGPVQSVQLLHKVGYLLSNAWYNLHHCMLQETFVLCEGLSTSYNETLWGLMASS